MVLTTAALCLAMNIYHEARGEPLTGQHAVAQVTMNRARRDPANLCAVVFEKKQFSWANALTASSGDARLLIARGLIPKAGKEWELAKNIAMFTVAGSVEDFTHGAMFYHTKKVHPFWAQYFELVATIGQHKFYRYG